MLDKFSFLITVSKIRLASSGELCRDPTALPVDTLLIPLLLLLLTSVLARGELSAPPAVLSVGELVVLPESALDVEAGEILSDDGGDIDSGVSQGRKSPPPAWTGGALFGPSGEGCSWGAFGEGFAGADLDGGRG